jgi:hypothetical protein
MQVLFRRRALPPTLLWGIVFALALPGCAFGPKALERTHGRYNESVRQVYEEELLRNIVHLRYNESSLNLNVNSIAAQYELSGQAEARPFFIAPNPSNSNIVFRTFTSILPDAQVAGSNRPTITLEPMDSSEAVRQYLTPIPASTLLFLAQTGWPTSSILRLWVERLNGVPNAVGASSPHRCAVSDFTRFQRIAELLQSAHQRELISLHEEERVKEVSGPLPAEAVTAAAVVEAAKNGLEYRRRADGKTWALVRPTRRLMMQINPGGIGSAEVADLQSLLNLVPGLARYDLRVQAGVPDPMLHPVPPSTELRIVPRSTAQVLLYLANGVEIPAEHVRCGLVCPPVGADGQPFDGREITRGLFEVHTAKGCKPPGTAYVAVKYRGWWYYLDDRDQESKATFALMLALSRLDFGGGQRRGGPLLTLPVGK